MPVFVVMFYQTTSFGQEIHCDQRPKTDCYTLGEKAFKQNDVEMATQYFTLGCQQNSGKSCTQLARITHKKGKVEETKKYLTKACDLKEEKSCEILKKLETQVRLFTVHWLNVDLNLNYNSQSGATNQGTGLGFFSDVQFKKSFLFFLVGGGGKPSKSANDKIIYIAEAFMAPLYKIGKKWRIGLMASHEWAFSSPTTTTTFAYGSRIHYNISSRRLWKLDELFLRYTHALYDVPVNSFYFGVTLKF